MKANEVLLMTLKQGERFRFARTENALDGVFTFIRMGKGLIEFGGERGGGYASKFCEVIKVND